MLTFFSLLLASAYFLLNYYTVFYCGLLLISTHSKWIGALHSPKAQEKFSLLIKHYITNTFANQRMKYTIFAN